MLSPWRPTASSTPAAALRHRRPLLGRACPAWRSPDARARLPAQVDRLDSPPVPSQPGGGGHRLTALESTLPFARRTAPPGQSSPLLEYLHEESPTTALWKPCSSVSDDLLYSRARVKPSGPHGRARPPFGTRTSRSAGRPVAFSGTQPVEPDPNPPACGCRGPSPPVHNRRGLFQVRVQSHRRTAPGLRPKERVLGTDSVRAVVPPGVTGLARLVYGLAARERLGTGYPPPRFPLMSRISLFSHLTLLGYISSDI